MFFESLTVEEESCGAFSAMAPEALIRQIICRTANVGRVGDSLMRSGVSHYAL